MPMPYQVVKSSGKFQIQGTVGGKLVNGKDMSFDTLAEAWSKVADLIKADYDKRVPEKLRKEIAEKIAKDYVRDK